MVLGEDGALALKIWELKDRVLRALSAWSGLHPALPARTARGEPAVLRPIAPLAFLTMAAIVACIAIGYVLARQVDGGLESERRQALAGAIEALRVVPANLSADAARLVPALERASGLKGLRFETEPASGDREVQSLLDRNGRIAGWFSWEPERPAAAMMTRLMPLVGFIALVVAGFAALAMWQLGRLGLLLAKSEQRVQKLGYEDILTGLPNHDHFFDLLEHAVALDERV